MEIHLLWCTHTVCYVPPCFTVFEREFVAAKDSTATLRQSMDQHLFRGNRCGIQTFLKSGF